MLDLDDALDRLAPEVDPIASRRLFEARRAGAAHPDRVAGHRLRRSLLAAAVVVVLIVGVAAVVTITRHDDRATTLDVTGPGDRANDPTITAQGTDLDVLGTLILPAAGTTGSGLLDDRTPVWVVHHLDATVSVLPALVDDGFVAPRQGDVPLPHPADLTGTLEVVLAVGSSGFRSNDVAWDPWGRTTTHERTRDLIGYAGIVVDGQVQVVASAIAPIPGKPEGPVDDGPGTLPAVPDLVASIDAATPGWNRLADVYLGGKDRVFRICPYPTGTETQDHLGSQSMEIVETCDGPVVAGVTGPPGAWVYAFGDPFLVHVDDTGALIGVGMELRSGGGSSSDD